MGHVRQTHLKMAAIRTLFYVDGVIEIARRLSVDGYDRQAAKIAATFSLGLSHRTRNFLGRVQHLLRELVRQMVFADQNLYIEAEFSRLSQNINNQGGCRNASLRYYEYLNRHHR